MQLSEYQPRLQSSDLELYQEVLSSMKTSRYETIEDEQNNQLKRPSISYSLGFIDAKQIGRFLYVLGYPLPEIRSYFLESAGYFLKLLEWYEIQGPPITTITTDNGRGKTEVESYEWHETQNPPIQTITTDDGRGNIKVRSYKDYSLTNSYDCLQGIYLALIAGDIELAKSIARLTLDPPDATYIHPKSEFSTPNYQHLAYAVKNLLFGIPDSCGEELSLIDINATRPRQRTELNSQVEMVKAILLRQPDVFENTLKDLVAWYEKTAPKMIQTTPKKRRDPDYPDYFMAISGLALFALARHQELIKEVNISSVYLPLDILKII